MNDITPQLISEIATRLYNEIPGASAIPKTDSEMPTLSPEAVTPAGITAFSPSELHLPSAEQPTAEPPAPPLAGDPNISDGVRAFVRSVRTTHFRPGVGVQGDESDEDHIRRLFTGKTTAATGSRPLDVAAIRRDFPALHQHVHGKPLAWLDNAATTQKPQEVIDALASFYAHDNSNIHRGAHTLAARSTDAFEQAR